MTDSGKQATAEHYAGMLDLAKQLEQPQIDASLTLLHSGYELMHGPRVDIYGVFAGGEYKVRDISLSGTKVSLREIADAKLLKSLSTWCNFYLPNVDQAEIQKELTA